MNLVTKEGQEDMMEVKINNKTEFGYSFVTSSAPWAKELTTKGLIRHQEPIQFTTEKPIHIFGLHGISTNIIYPADFSTESLERLEHAIILTLTFDDEY